MVILLRDLGGVMREKAHSLPFQKPCLIALKLLSRVGQWNLSRDVKLRHKPHKGATYLTEG